MQRAQRRPAALAIRVHPRLKFRRHGLFGAWHLNFVLGFLCLADPAEAGRRPYLSPIPAFLFHPLLSAASVSIRGKNSAVLVCCPCLLGALVAWWFNQQRGASVVAGNHSRSGPAPSLRVASSALRCSMLDVHCSMFAFLLRARGAGPGAAARAAGKPPAHPVRKNARHPYRRGYNSAGPCTGAQR